MEVGECMKELTVNAAKRLPKNTLIKYEINETSFGYFKIAGERIYFNCIFNGRRPDFMINSDSWLVSDWKNYWISSKEEYCLYVLENA